eukprot:6169361-Ditylum_brightwellii.AAC.1
MILIRRDGSELQFVDLPDVPLGSDYTTEYNRVRIFFVVNNKPLLFDICNIYTPLIGGGGNHQIQCFNAETTFGNITKEDIDYGSVGVLIAGDINAHANIWDRYAKEDAIREDIKDFLDDNGFRIINITLPTYHSHCKNAQNTHINEMAPDVTFLKPDTVKIKD